MAMLSMCDHLILSTGSFSFWSAFLDNRSNSKPNRTVIVDQLQATPNSKLNKQVYLPDMLLPEWHVI